jgi:hypothetical protein
VTGNIKISNLAALSTLHMDGLKSTNGYRVDTVGALSELGLHSLGTVTLEFYVGNCKGSPSFDVPNLTTVHAFTFEYDSFSSISGFQSLSSCAADLVIKENPNLTSISGCQSFTSVAGGIYLIHNSLITSYDGLSNLSSLGTSLLVQMNPALTSFSMNVQSLPQTFVLDGSPLLSTIAFPKLTTAGSLGFSSLGNLLCLRLPLLRTVSSLYITGDPMLPTCQATAILAQLTSGGGSSFTSGTNDSGTCPSAACP